jgi:hypothetical protein
MENIDLSSPQYDPSLVTTYIWSNGGAVTARTSIGAPFPYESTTNKLFIQVVVSTCTDCYKSLDL